jgi:hypothetical protein
MEFVFFVVAFIAEVVGTIAGFGSSTIALPLSLLFFDFKTALVLVAFLHIFGNIGRVGFFRYGLDKNILIKFGLASVVFSVIGALLVNYTPQENLKGILGLFLIIYSFLAWFEKLAIKPSNTAAVVGGGLSGFFAGLIGTGGALRGAFLTAFNLPKEKYIATAAAIALAVDATRLPVYLKQGFLSSNFYWFVPVLFVIAIAGSFVGKNVVERLPQALFRKLVLIAILLIGLKFIYDWLVS